MTATADFARGFALAAAIAGDRGAARAAAGLDATARDSWLSEATALAALDRAGRHQRLRAWTQPRPLDRDPGGHPRARSLLASQASGALARQLLLSGAPDAREGFAPEPGLMRVLRRIADAESGANERGGSPWGG